MASENPMGTPSRLTYKEELLFMLREQEGPLTDATAHISKQVMYVEQMLANPDDES